MKPAQELVERLRDEAEYLYTLNCALDKERQLEWQAANMIEAQAKRIEELERELAAR